MDEKYRILRLYRKKEHLTWKEFSCLIGLPEKIVYRALHGTTTPNEINDYKIDQFIKSHMSDLLPLMAEDGHVVIGEEIKNIPL